MRRLQRVKTMDEAGRIDALPWTRITEELDRLGCARTGKVLSAAECQAFRCLYGDDDRFRRHIVMARHGYGSGDYKYFSYPLPEPIADLRSALYRHLAGIANRWHAALGAPERFPPEHGQFLAACHAAGQVRPTPLLLRYGAEDYNCLHQDLYGPMVFPLQVVFLLSAPGEDFEGGEFVLTEQRPRAQSRAEVVPLQQGEAVIFAVNARPAAGARGPRRVNLRHGVSRVRTGERLTMGLIFHDAA
jgi:hypothetical protein